MSVPSRLPTTHRPVAITLDVSGLIDRIARVQAELGDRAALDQNRCCGYFPALEGVRGMVTELPACRVFRDHLPSIEHSGANYQFNFIRLSLTQQSADPVFHLDSDAATALSGDVTTLRQRRVARLLLNLSSEDTRTVHFLDIDPFDVDLISDGSYVRVAEPLAHMERAFTVSIPARCGSCVAGLAFTANLVLHSGVDDPGGHFVAA
jgi:hypothetical protein